MSYIFYFGFKKIPSKPKCWDFQVSGENFLNSSCHFWNSIFIQILHQYSVLSNITPLCIFRSNIIYFDQRHPLKWNFWDFWVLQSKFVKLLMPILNWEVNSSSIIASFFILMTHNSLVNFKLKYFQLWTKESHQSPHFETYKCSGENLPNSLCYFPNQKLVFLQILQHCLMSWKIHPLDFFRSKITRKDQSKCKLLELLSAWIKIHQMLVIFETTNQFSFNFIYQSWVPLNITSLYFLSLSIIYFDQKQPIKVQIFEIFECLGQHLLNSSCQFWTSQFLFKFCIFFHCHNT